MTSIAIAQGPMAWRLRIRSQSTFGNPDGASDAIIVSSVPGVGTAVIAAEPSGDGAELDPLGGTTVTANYRVNVIDAATASQTLAGIIPGPNTQGGIITGSLGDANGRSQLISRRAYLEQSFDGGNTWPVTLCAGYINRLRLISAATYEVTVGETRRVEQTVPIFQTIAPGLDQGTCLMGGPIAWQQAPAQYFTIANTTAVLWNPTTTWTPGVPVSWNGIVYVGINTGNLNKTPPNSAYWMPVVGPLNQNAGVWSSATTFLQGQTTVGSDGRTYVALVGSTNVQPVNNASGDWMQLAPTINSTPHVNIVQAAPWNNTTSYVPGNVVYSNGITYVCIAGNTNDIPPDVAHWTAVPAGAPVAGVWSAAVSYPAGIVVVGGDGNAYLSITTSTNQNPVQDIQNVYWVPVAAIDFGTWGPITEYGGMLCVVVATGKTSNTIKANPLQGWAKVPSPKAGDPAWSYIGTSPTGGGFPSKYLALINQGVPALVQGYGPSPVGYGATYLESLTGPRNGSAPFPVGLVDTFTDGTTPQLGWIAGAIAIQVITAGGNRVTTNCYTQILQQSADNNRQWTQTPVLLSQGPNDPGTFYIDWHDFYQVNPATGAPIAPVDTTGNPAAMPAVGSIIQVKAVAVPITSDWPLHISMHPIDLLTTIWTTLQIPYDVVNVSDIRSALGDDLILLARVTGPMTAAQVFEQWIGGPLGVGLRVSSSAVQSQFAGVTCGCYQLVLTRQPPSALPTVAWTDDDCYGEPGHEQPIYDLDEATTCQQVSYQYQSYIPWSSNSSASRTGDDAVEIDNTMTFVSQDYAVFGTTTEQYTIPGGYGSASIQQAQTMSQYGSQWSNQIFERFSRGATQTTAFILASSPQANLGDLVLWESNRMPNPALNERGGQRLCMVVKKTFHPMGAEYVLEDLGPAEQPAPLAPTISPAADPADPFHTVDLTVTNLVLLQEQYPNGSIQVQYTVQANQPGTAQQGIVGADVSLASIGSAATLVMPAVAMGATVWYRANARPGAGALPSVWTAWTSITLSSPGAISGLTATPGAGGTCLLQWTNPDTNLTTPIQLWLAAGPLGASGAYSVILSNASFTLTAGQTLQLSAQTYNSQGVLQTGSTYNWTSLTPAVATVNASTGLVTAVSAGTVTIEATDTTAGRGSPVGESFGTINAAAPVGQVIITPSTFQFGASASPFTLSVTVKDTNGNTIGSPTVTVGSSNHSVATATIAGTTITVTPGGSTGQTTITATCSGVNGTALGTAIATFANLAQAARAANGKKFLLAMNQSYPNDNFAVVGGVQNTSLGLPPLKSNYGTFTPGVVDGLNWPELVDINGVVNFAAGATASATNNAAIASITTQLWWHERVLVDSIRAIPASSGAGVLCIGSSATANKKVEMYIQTGSAGTAQLTAAAYETGSVRSALVSTPATALTAFPPPGCWVNCIVAVDTSSAHTLSVYMYDDNNNLIASGSTALSTALNTDGGANGAIFLNVCFNTGAAPTQPMVYGGLEILSGTLPGTAAARWAPGNGGDSGLLALYLMGDAVSGSIASIQHNTSGTNFTTSGTVTGQYDNGGRYNWLIYPSQPGGEVTDENQWKEFHFISGMSGAGQITFSYGMDGTIKKCRSLGITSRGYLFQGSTGAAIPQYSTYVTTPATATQALQTVVTGIVGRMVNTYGTAAAGGINVWNIANEFLQAGQWQNSIWYQQLGAAWVPDVAAMVYAIDPSAYIMINLDNIELASDTAQQAAVAAVINAIVAKGIPAAQIILGNEFHLNNVHGYTAADASNYAAFVLGLPSGVLVSLSEPDMTDIALPGTGSASRGSREILSNAAWQAVYGSTCLGAAGVWTRCWGTGAWEKSSLANWLNVSPPAGSIRSDGDFEESSIVDENYNRYGGAGSSADSYGTILAFLAGQAA